MEDNERIELARNYCLYYHEGQVRKGSKLPYHTHPDAVARILARYGYIDCVTQCIAYLHDTVEDSKLRMDEIQEIFGYEISNGVYILSKNKGKMGDEQKLSHEDYMQRLSWARNKIKRVKIADVIHNTEDLETLTPKGIEEKISDAERFYIPWGREIAPIMIIELICNIDNYHRMKKK